MVTTRVALIVALSSAVSVWAASDYQFTLNNDGFGISYRLTSVSSPKVYAGSLPANNPTINLIQGRRYGITVVDFGIHPVEIIARGATAGSDVVLLSQGFLAGSLEGDAGIAWVDSGGVVEFTVTPTLVAAMRQGGRTPGYRCGVHVTTMRGGFALFGTGTEITDPIPTPIPKGNLVIELEPVVTGLTAPLGVLDPDDGTGRLMIYDQAGLIHIVQNGQLLAEPFLDVRSRLVPLGIVGPGTFDERGLIGCALHPHFAHTGKIYTYTSEPVAGPADFTLSIPPDRSFNHQSVIAEWTVSAMDPNRIDPSTRRELLRIDQPQFNHNGGVMRFGPDGYLYFSLGDGGGADDADGQISLGQPIVGHGPDGNGQNKETIHGSIVRIDVHGNNSANGRYGVPGDNPFVNAPGVDEIYAYGLRNPYSFSFDLVTGDLYVGDVGQNDIEEIDIIVKGGNYGWRLKEGSFFFDPNGNSPGFVTTEPVEPLPPGLIDPIAEYDHDEGISIIGGFVYRGSAIPALVGHYVFADYQGRLFYLDSNGKIAEFRLGFADRPLGRLVKGFGQDADGELYICVTTAVGPFENTGVVLKLIPAVPAMRCVCAVAPRPADMDGDGIADAAEFNPDVATPATGTNRYLWDSDGDGLSDGYEDANRNGTRDAGELDPRDRDTDDDGIRDGVEVFLLQSNPLNGASPGALTDADADGLPVPFDPNDTTADTDSDRYADGFEAIACGIGAVSNAQQVAALGDLDCNFGPTNLDALMAQSVQLGSAPHGLFSGESNGDVNRDGFVTNLDALVIQSWFVQLPAAPYLPLPAL